MRRWRGRRVIPLCSRAWRHSRTRSRRTRGARSRGRALQGRPIAFFCAEFGVHESLPIYSGGLGGLAGDLLKEASDQALPLVAVGLMYRQGYFRQRLEVTGLAAGVLG